MVGCEAGLTVGCALSGTGVTRVGSEGLYDGIAVAEEMWSFDSVDYRAAVVSYSGSSSLVEVVCCITVPSCYGYPDGDVDGGMFGQNCWSLVMDLTLTVGYLKRVNT